jgi:hypothetical protein
MKKLMIGLVAATSLVFGTGCGNSACEDAADALSGLSDKTRNCPQFNAILSELQFSDAEIEQCEEDCDGDDKDALADAADCLNDLPQCQAGQEAAWATALSACSNDLNEATCDG